MSSIIEANAYAQDFQASDVTITNSNTQFSALAAFLVVMMVAAFAGIALSAPVVTIAAGIITAGTVVTATYSAINNN